MKVKAKKLTYEDFGNRITHTNEYGTTTTRVITGVQTELRTVSIINHVPDGEKPYLKASYMVTKISFMDGTHIWTAGDEEVELDEDTTPLEFKVYYPGRTGLR